MRKTFWVTLNSNKPKLTENLSPNILSSHHSHSEATLSQLCAQTLWTLHCTLEPAGLDTRVHVIDPGILWLKHQQNSISTTTSAALLSPQNATAHSFSRSKTQHCVYNSHRPPLAQARDLCMSFLVFRLARPVMLSLLLSVVCLLS